jgi:hypothetical protein
MNEIFINKATFEQKQITIGGWIESFSLKQEVKEFSPRILREVLTSHGANFENLSDEAKESLKGYSEKERGMGIRAVWGDDVVDSYKEWTKEYIKGYEAKTGIILPELKPSGRKNSGMIQFFNDLTSLASGECNFDTFRTYTEGRVKNGVAWSEGRKGDRIRVSVPTSSEPILLSSIPKEFPIAAWEWISKKKQKS